MTSWAEVQLKELLQPVKRPVSVAGLEEVRWAGARWHAEGIYARPVEQAQNVKAKTLNRLAVDDVTYNRMWATKGAFGIVDGDAAGCLVTGDFPVFTVDKGVLEPGYLRSIFQTRRFQDEAAARAVGTTERRRLKEAEFLSMRISLPSLPEQRRIVEVVTAVGTQERALLREIESAERLYAGASTKLWLQMDGGEAETLPLSRVMRLDLKRVSLNPEFSYRSAGVLNAGKGLIDKGSFRAADTAYVTMNELSADQVVMRKLTAWEGPITVVPPHFDGYLASSEFPTFTLEPEISPDWMRHVCRTSRLWHEMKNRVTGSVQRRKRLNPDQLLSVSLPVPHRDAQEQAAAALDSLEVAIDALRQEHARVRALRHSLVASLLDQGTEIPDSYDAFWEEAP